LEAFALRFLLIKSKLGEKGETIMAIRIESKKTIAKWCLLGSLLIAALLLLAATQVRAETVKIKYTTQATKVEVVPVPDEKGHLVGLYERRGVAIFENEVAATALCGTMEIVNKKVSFQGYTKLTFKDGSTWLLTHQGTRAPAPGDELGSYKMNGEIIKGTGRFEGIKGKYSATGRLITPRTKDATKGDNWIEATATYTVPEK
jgi:hypothetical protein